MFVATAIVLLSLNVGALNIFRFPQSKLTSSRLRLSSALIDDAILSINNSTGVGSIAASVVSNVLTVPIQVGDQPAVFNVIIDTGSANLWLKDPRCDSLCDLDGLLQKSKTFENDPGTSFAFHYADGTRVEGRVHSDIIKLGGTALARQNVGGVQFWSSQTYFDDDGIAGLSSLGANVSTIDANIFDAIKQKFGKAQVGFWYDRTVLSFNVEGKQMPNGGSVSFGGPDPSKYTGQLRYLQLEGKEDFWQTKVAGVSVGGASISLMSPLTAIFDTGTSLSLIPEYLFEEMTKPEYGFIPTELQVHTIPCENAKRLPELVLTLDGGFQIRLTWEKQIIVLQGYCYSSFMTTPINNMTILGVTVLRNFYTLFDGDEHRIGFADPVGESPIPVFSDGRVAGYKNSNGTVIPVTNPTGGNHGRSPYHISGANSVAANVVAIIALICVLMLVRQ